MILLKCSRCGRAADVPDELADEDHQCFACGLPLHIADPIVAQHRSAAHEGQYCGLIVGAFAGAAGVALAGVFGGNMGFALVGAIAGSVLGVAWGFIEGLVGGAEWAVLMWDSSWLSFWAKICMIGGGISGFLMGLFGEWSDDLSRQGIIGVGMLGGLCLGGLLGAAFSRSRTRPDESRGT